MFQYCYYVLIQSPCSTFGLVIELSFFLRSTSNDVTMIGSGLDPNLFETKGCVVVVVVENILGMHQLIFN